MIPQLPAHGNKAICAADTEPKLVSFSARPSRERIKSVQGSPAASANSGELTTDVVRGSLMAIRHL